MKYLVPVVWFHMYFTCSNTAVMVRLDGVIVTTVNLQLLIRVEAHIRAQNSSITTGGKINLLKYLYTFLL